MRLAEIGAFLLLQGWITLVAVDQRDDVVHSEAGSASLSKTFMPHLN